MKKKYVASLTAAILCSMSLASASPLTSFEQGQAQLDLGAWDTKASMSGTQDSSYHWNFNGGLTYGLSNKVALQYAYHGLNEGGGSYDGFGGSQNEVNVLYSFNKNLAGYAGWDRINFSKGSFDKTNNIAQLGLAAKTAIAKNLDLYGNVAIGTQKTTIWEAGLGYNITKDLDLNVGYRYVDTKASENANMKFQGVILGLSYRFGGGEKKAVPAPAPVTEPAAPVVHEQPAPHVYKDYYVESVHFDFDEDTPMASEQPNLDHFVSVARENPNATFKLVGNTDAKGTDSYNEDLSARRVANIQTYAVNQGVSSSKLQATYRGENNPVSDNDTEQGRADNRRVDIYMNK